MKCQCKQVRPFPKHTMDKCFLGVVLVDEEISRDIKEKENDTNDE